MGFQHKSFMHIERSKANWFYGRQVVREILKSEKVVKKILIADESQDKIWDELVRISEQKGVPIEKVPKKVLDSLCKGNHQGIAIQIEQGSALNLNSFLELLANRSNKFVSLLDEIQDPQNLGAILRSALCFNCSGVIISKWRSAHLTSAVMRSSSGAASHLSIVQIPNLTVAVERLKQRGFYIYGADPQGTPLTSMRFEFPLAILLGNEHRGLKPILKKACDRLVSIPQLKTIASLNVSVAAAIFFYEISKKLDSFQSG